MFTEDKSPAQGISESDIGMMLFPALTRIRQNLICTPRKVVPSQLSSIEPIINNPERKNRKKHNLRHNHHLQLRLPNNRQFFLPSTVPISQCRTNGVRIRICIAFSRIVQRMFSHQNSHGNFQPSPSDLLFFN